MEEVTKIYHMCPHCGRQYQKKGYLILYNLTGEPFAEAIKREVIDLLEGREDKIRLFNFGCTTKQIEADLNFSLEFSKQ